MTRRQVKIIILFFLITALSIAVFWIYFEFCNRSRFELIFFNIGQGDSALIKFENNQTVLVDCSKDRSVLNKLGEYLPFFERSLDYLIITHFDLDHYGGCIDLLKRYNIKNVVINGVIGNDEYYQTFSTLLDDKIKKGETKVLTIGELKELKISSSTLIFLWPLRTVNVAGDNNNSIVFSLKHKNNSVLFTGDLEEKGENFLLKEYAKNLNFLKADVLKVSHHGSVGASSEDFLKAVNPKEAIISVGKNDFGHPSLRIIKRLERLGAKIWRTNLQGDKIIYE